ncbi:hypothetical protein TPHA_0F01270 [Tetrapisispora phaffii CBS 4417]|uniref:Vacuolar membrane protein n=1 Tax=Tetrapisispora phaffii (strain ATCC 24235 / CBS 4417 / NBRC 1672 / NRRL Y-8282 / UCD 70-5) TaxID=1071381 RepID=G8BV30_TETPH|nr:hypothetical protein TPHA_0F01270 [Tetrapisispora phaffii CBS 4417]CCE63612.1 hypothetical protein TPHA_0F01270 [Tetrapisispora phaffii CBS 4417]
MELTSHSDMIHQIEIPSSLDNPYIWKTSDLPNGLVFIVVGAIFAAVISFLVIWIVFDNYDSQKRTSESFRSYHEKYEQQKKKKVTLSVDNLTDIVRKFPFVGTKPDSEASCMFDEEALQNRRNPLIISPTLEMQIAQKQNIIKYHSRSALSSNGVVNEINNSTTNVK